MTSRAIEQLEQRGGAVEWLRVPAALYGLVTRARAALYDRGVLPVGVLDVPVVSVGNLTTGGVGKTPMVRWLAERFRGQGVVPGVLSRGYRARVGERSDEARELCGELAWLLHVENPDRIAGGAELVRLGADVIVLDDGFQHRRLHRDLDIVLVDATRPWGLSVAAEGDAPVRALLPRGLLREPCRALGRADLVVLTRSDHVSEGTRERLVDELTALAPGRAIALASHVPFRLRTSSGAALDLEALSGLEVDLASGIGNPRAFERTITGLGARIAEHRVRPDHHHWVAADLGGLGNRPLVTTGKDAVKLREIAPEAWILDVRFELQAGRGALEALLDALPVSSGPRARAALHPGLHG